MSNQLEDSAALLEEQFRLLGLFVAALTSDPLQAVLYSPGMLEASRDMAREALGIFKADPPSRP